MEKWEYNYHVVRVAGVFSGVNTKKATEDAKQELNKMGDEGWELVSAYPLAGVDGVTFFVVHLFKRRKAV